MGNLLSNNNQKENKKMKKVKIIYWVATGIFSLMMAFLSYNYLTSPDIKGAFVHLGFPDYFRIELAIAKILGVLALLLPFVPKGFKLFAYAGFTVNLISASVAHASSGDPVSAIITPLVFWAILIVSYIYYEKLQKEVTAN